MSICNRTFDVFSVPGHVVMSRFTDSCSIGIECIMQVLLYIYAWKDTFGIDTKSVAGIDTEISSKSYVIVVGVS